MKTAISTFIILCTLANDSSARELMHEAGFDQTETYLNICNRGTGEFIAKNIGARCDHVSKSALESISKLSFGPKGKHADPVCPSDELKAGSFDGLTALREIDLKVCRITSIEAGAFRDQRNLESMNFLFSEIEDIEPGAFRDLQHLKRLILGIDGLKQLKREHFNGLNSLEDLSIDGHENVSAMTRLVPGVFSDLSNLVKLEVVYTGLKTLESGAFQGLNKLKVLTIGYNSELTSIKAGAFSDLPELKELNLEESAISTIEDFAFNQLQNLESLALDENRLASIGTNTFSGLTNLRNLSLQGNWVEYVGEGAFRDLLKFESLYISTPLEFNSEQRIQFGIVGSAKVTTEGRK